MCSLIASIRNVNRLIVDQFTVNTSILSQTISLTVQMVVHNCINLCIDCIALSIYIYFSLILFNMCV